jgi:hypothetical protein
MTGKECSEALLAMNDPKTYTEDEYNDLRRGLASVSLENARLAGDLTECKRLVDYGEWGDVPALVDAALAAPDDGVVKLRDDIQRVHDLCFGEPVSVGMPGDVSHADRDHAEAHRILDALLRELGEA